MHVQHQASKSRSKRASDSVRGRHERPRKPTDAAHSSWYRKHIHMRRPTPSGLRRNPVWQPQDRLPVMAPTMPCAVVQRSESPSTLVVLRLRPGCETKTAVKGLTQDELAGPPRARATLPESMDSVAAVCVCDVSGNGDYGHARTASRACSAAVDVRRPAPAHPRSPIRRTPPRSTSPQQRLARHSLPRSQPPAARHGPCFEEESPQDRPRPQAPPRPRLRPQGMVSRSLQSTRNSTPATCSIQLKLSLVQPPNTTSLMDFGEIFAELVKRTRPSLVSAAPTERIGTIRSNQESPHLYQDNGLSSDEGETNSEDKDEDGPAPGSHLASLYIPPSQGFAQDGAALIEQPSRAQPSL
ncbi:hypothetical protein C2E23DRAFT_883346 [Lenzites betulinus]|nr:hypothetical protein C2E23DRAFT_883346 [Lenzites betulinus]